MVLLNNKTPFAAELRCDFERDGHESIVIVVKATFVLPRERGGLCLRADRQEPLFHADIFGPDPATDAVIFENDFAPIKPHCDVLVHGPAIAPEGRPTTDLPVGVRLGNWSKHFIALGSRIWLGETVGFRVSDKRPFTRQKIGYDHAYGGTDPITDSPGQMRTYEENPVGLGYYPSGADVTGRPLAQTCQPGRDPVNRDGGYVPMAFGPVGRSWLPRRRWAGTYDDRWLDHRMPFLPDDFDSRYFQASAPDQWVPFPKGGEVLELLNLTSVPRVTTSLPQLSVVMTFTRKSGRVTQKIGRLDTVLILGEEMRLCLTWREKLVTERDIFEVDAVNISVRGEIPAIAESAA